MDGACRVLRTTWIPRAHIAKTDTVDLREVEFSIKAVGALRDGAAVGENQLWEVITVMVNFEVRE